MSDLPLPIRFDDSGLIPAVITDTVTGDVLMLGFMNREAFDATRATGYVHFWSRSRQQLWKKGETSGHVQRVEHISVNCERNSLLIEVTQTGAVCHDGYPTCYYRRLESDNSLTISRDRWFDPADIYGEGVGIAHLSYRWWSSYEWLRDHDLTAESRTSGLLRAIDDGVTSRLGGELEELAGVLDGAHRHTDFASDIALEAGQVCYWLALRCIRDGFGWHEVRPDRALDAPGEAASPIILASLLRAESVTWGLVSPDGVAAQAHSTFTLIAAACEVAGIAPAEVIQHDLDELRARPYLSGFFARANGQSLP